MEDSSSSPVGCNLGIVPVLIAYFRERATNPQVIKEKTDCFMSNMDICSVRIIFRQPIKVGKVMQGNDTMGENTIESLQLINNICQILSGRVEQM